MAEEVQVTPVVQRKAAVMQNQLTEAGLPIDPALIISIITALLGLFKVPCPTPPAPNKVYQRLRAFSGGRWYLGKNMDEARVLGIIRDSDCGVPEDVMLSAVKDLSGTFTLEETREAMQP